MHQYDVSWMLLLAHGIVVRANRLEESDVCMRLHLAAELGDLTWAVLQQLGWQGRQVEGAARGYILRK